MNAKSNRFCPVCKFLIDLESEYCPNCGRILVGSYDVHSTTARVSDEDIRSLIEKDLIDESQYPEQGIALYLYKDPAILISTQLEEEFSLGRKTGFTSELSESTLLDLGPYDGYSLGVSRRHALIRKSEDGYDILDLDSTNGTQLNGVRMVPKKHYNLENGSVIRTGNLSLYVVFRSKSQRKDS